MRRLAVVVAIFIVATAPALADEWVVEAHYPDHAALARAAANFQHVIVDDKRAVLRVTTDESGIDTLEDAGLVVSIDTAGTAKLRAFEAAMAQAKTAGHGIDSIPGFQCFRTVEETYQTMDDMVAAHPDIVTIDNLGPTWKKSQNAAQGYEMRALRITNLATASSDPARPRMVVFSSIHAREYAPAEVDTRFAEWLVNGYGSDPEATWLVDHNDFRLVLQANPDGRKQAEQQILWRKNDDQITGNCDGNPNAETNNDGIDLNRNFPFHWHIVPNNGGSSGSVCSETYRGPLKASEPESQNLVQYVAGTCADDGTCSGGVFADRRAGPMNPSSTSGDGGAAAPLDTTGFFVDIHSNAALVLWSWGDTSNAAPNQVALRTLGRRIAYFNGYTPEQSDSLYATDGTTDDTFYGLLGVPGFTIETDGSGFFEDCATFESKTAPDNIAGLRYAARMLHAPYRLPAGPDTVTVTPVPDLIAIGTPSITVKAHLDSSRFNQFNGTETVRTIASAAAYVDQLPWDTYATAYAMSANDGTFNSSIEDVTVPVATGTLALGRHLVQVQGTDSAANAGTPNAAFVDVVAADQIAMLQGVISDNTSGAPVVATVTASDSATGEQRAATGDAGTGNYLRPMFPGTVNVHVSAPHYLSEDLNSVVLAAQSTVTHNFSLLPDCTIDTDDVESGNTLWTVQSPWVVSTTVTGNTTHAWNTPNYGNNLNSSLTLSSARDLTGYSDISVDFDDRCDTEAGYDYGYVEFSANGGTSWNAAYSCNGRPTWKTNHIALSTAANGASAFKLRFRLTSDLNTNKPGWSIDNIRIAAGGVACRAQQQPDEIFKDGFNGG